MTDPAAPPPPMPMPSTELFAYAIGLQGWLLLMPPEGRAEAIATLRRVVNQTVEQSWTIVPMWPQDLRAAAQRRLQEAGAWWLRTLDEVEA